MLAAHEHYWASWTVDASWPLRPLRSLGQVGRRRKIGRPRVAKGPKPRSALSAASSPVRGALIALMAATAQAQAEATKAAQRAGIEHAKQSGDRAYLGRKPSFTR